MEAKKWGPEPHALTRPSKGEKRMQPPTVLRSEIQTGSKQPLSLTAHFSLPSSFMQKRGSAGASGRASGPFVLPGKTTGAEAEASPTSPVHTLLWKVESELRVGAAEPSSQSWSELLTEAERTKNLGTGTPALGNPEAQRRSLCLAAGWRVIPRFPGESPKGKDPTQRDVGEQLECGAVGRAEGSQLGRRALDP